MYTFCIHSVLKNNGNGLYCILFVYKTKELVFFFGLGGYKWVSAFSSPYTLMGQYYNSLSVAIYCSKGDQMAVH